MSLRTFRTWRSASLPPETAKAYPPTPQKCPNWSKFRSPFPFGATAGHIFQRCFVTQFGGDIYFFVFFWMSTKPGPFQHFMFFLVPF